MIGADFLALEAASHLDIDITLVVSISTKDWNSPMAPGTRTLLVDDHTNLECVLTALRRAGLDGSSFDAVYAHDDLALMTAAAIGRILDIRAISPDTVVLFRDKYLQKRRLAEHGVPVTAHHVIEDIRNVSPDFAMPFEHGVAKPVAGTATEATFVVHGLPDLLRVSAQCRASHVTARTYVLEEFVDGVEWFADGVILGGEVRFLSVGRYAQNCLTAITERRPVRTVNIDPSTEKWAYELARPLVTNALTALGLRDGVFHMEMFHHADTGALVFSECAARRGGGPIRDEILYKFGVDLAACAMLIALGDLTDIPTQVRDGVVASTYLPMVNGTVVGYPSAAEIVAQDGVVHTRLYLPTGFRYSGGAATTTFGRLGDVMVHADTEEAALRRLDEVTDWFTGEMEILPLNPTFLELWEHPRNAGAATVASAAIGDPRPADR